MKFDTKLLHAGYNPKDHNMCINVPIYPTTAFDFGDVQRGADLFDLKCEGDIYTRMSNPTTNILETRIASLEGGVGALCLSSGQAATTCAILNITKTGENIVAAPTLYGGTYNLFSSTFKKMGIEVRFAKGESPQDFEELIDDKTRCIFIEILSNPALNIIDIEKVAQVAHKNNIPLIVDNTVPTPYLCKPFEWGADIVIHSTTKYISGHGNVMGGAIVDSGNFDWAKSGKFKELTEPDSTYHGIEYVKTFGKMAYIIKARVQNLRDLGSCQSPFNSYLTLIGLETLNLRMERHCSSALKIAEYLEQHHCVSWVNYPGLKSSKYFALAQKYTPKGCSSMVGFGVKGGAKAGEKFINSLKIPIHTTNIGDSRSIITYPYLTTHRQLNEAELKACGISDDFMRLSVGLEDLDDLKEDLNQALLKSQEG